MKAALAGLAAVLLLTGPTTADDDSALWRRLRATAADYNARTWVRLETADGRSAWVESHDAARLVPHRGRPRRVLVLWPDSINFVAHVGDGVRYTISQQTFDCARQRMTVHNFFFHPDGALLAERVPEAGEFTEDDLIYQVVCKGASVKAGRRWSSAGEVIANEPDYGLDEE